jgi:hypothetical protein
VNLKPPASFAPRAFSPAENSPQQHHQAASIQGAARTTSPSPSLRRSVRHAKTDIGTTALQSSLLSFSLEGDACSGHDLEDVIWGQSLTAPGAKNCCSWHEQQFFWKSLPDVASAIYCLVRDQTARPGLPSLQPVHSWLLMSSLGKGMSRTQRS